MYHHTESCSAQYGVLEAASDWQQAVSIFEFMAGRVRENIWDRIILKLHHLKVVNLFCAFASILRGLLEAAAHWQQGEPPSSRSWPPR